jgi:predicted lipid-binding transport protein (Tim44 family)
MKNWLIGALVVAIAATVAPTPSEAKRLGGGKPAGMQRNMPARTAPNAPPAQPATPAQQAAPAQQPGAAGAVPAAAPKRSWMGPLAGLAAGLGLAALFSHFGLGEGLANFVMIALLALAAVVLIRFLMRRFGGGRTPTLAAAGAGARGPQAAWPPAQPAERRQIEPTLLAPATTASGRADTGPAATLAEPATRAFVPAAFDSEGFARTAKMIFIRLQAANDSADLDDLRRFTTPEMFAAVRLEIQERGTAAQVTDVLKVEAEVLDVANEAERQIVSVRFHGQVVEEKSAAATDFNEIWHLVKPLDGSRDWSIAGIEQAH